MICRGGKRALGRRRIVAAAMLTIAFAACLTMSAAARAEGPYVYQGGTLDLDLSDFGDFNLVPHAVGEDPDFLFRQDYGAEGDAGLAIHIPALGQSYGLAAGQGLYSTFAEPLVQETDAGKVITSRLWVDDPNDLAEPPVAALFEITQTFILSNTNQTVSVEYAIENVSGGPLRMRPYLLGTPYLLDRSQFELEENTIKSTFSKAPSPALVMASTKASRSLAVISTGASRPNSAQVFGYDFDGNNAGLERIYTSALTPGIGFTGVFDTAPLADPAFGLAWSDWMKPTGLGAGQTARIAASSQWSSWAVTTSRANRRRNASANVSTTNVGPMCTRHLLADRKSIRSGSIPCARVFPRSRDRVS